MRQCRCKKKRALDPLSQMIDAGLNALNKAVERFVTSEMADLNRHIAKMRRG